MTSNRLASLLLWHLFHLPVFVVYKDVLFVSVLSWLYQGQLLQLVTCEA